MADLLVVAQPSGGLTNYGIAVDGIAVTFVANTGTVAVNGACGDGSVHGVMYGFDGPVGETLSFAITCAGTVVYAVAGATITNPPHGGSGGDFRI